MILGSKPQLDMGHPLNRGRVTCLLGLQDTMSPEGWRDIAGDYPFKKAPTPIINNPQDHQISFSNDYLTPLLDGGASSVYFADFFPYPLSRFTMAAWFYPTNFTFGESHSLCGDFTSSSNAILLYIYCPSNGVGRVSGYVVTSAGTADFFDNVTISTGQWNFVAMTWDGSNFKTHVNGYSSVAGTSAVGGTITSIPTTCFVGRALNYTSFTKGYIGEVGVWNRPLSEEDLRRYIFESRGNGYGSLLYTRPDTVITTAAAGGTPIMSRKGGSGASLENASEYVW